MTVKGAVNGFGRTGCNMLRTTEDAAAIGKPL